MKPKIGIGLTTYKNISDPEHGRKLYDELKNASPRLVPDTTREWTDVHVVRNAADFASHWHCERKLFVHPKYGVTPPPHWAELGSEWKIRGALSGNGEHRFPNDPNGAAGVTLRCNFDPKVDWRGLFQGLIALFDPAHAMMHLFTDREIEAAGSGRFAFRGAFAGEEHFTAWLSGTGDWRKPDPWQLKERREFRFLPDLAWANYLGLEFSGRYDEAALRTLGSVNQEAQQGIYIQVTPNLRDVILDPAGFEAERARLRGAFAADFFRTGEGLG